MADEKQDILEEAKEQYDKPGRDFDYLRRASFLKLRQEVERLRSILSKVSRSFDYKAGYDALWNDMGELEGKYNSLTKELAQADKDLKWTQSIFDKERETRKKLEAENIKHQGYIGELEEQLEALKKERDTLVRGEIGFYVNTVKRLQKELKTERDWVDHASEKNNKLEAENAHLKKKLDYYLNSETP